METLLLLVSEIAKKFRYVAPVSDIKPVNTGAMHKFITSYVEQRSFDFLEDLSNLISEISTWPSNKLFDEEKDWLLLTFSNGLSLYPENVQLTNYNNNLHTVLLEPYLYPDDFEILYRVIESQKHLLLPYFLTVLSYFNYNAQQFLEIKFFPIEIENKEDLKTFISQTNERIEFLLKIL